MTDTEESRSRAGTAARRARPDWWIPAIYAAFAAAWIAGSDRLVTLVARSPGQIEVISTVKGFAFVAVTAALLHVALRRVFARERDARERLEASERLLRAVTDSIGDPVFLKDRQGRWLFANPATLAVLGRPLEALLGRSDAEIYADPAIGEAIMRADRRIMESGEAATVEEAVDAATGRRIFLSSKAPYRDADGRVVGIVGYARDVTARRSVEEAEREKRALADQLAKIAGSVPGAVYSFRLRPDGAVALPYATQAFEELFGLPREAVAEDLGPWLAQVHPVDRERALASLSEAGRTLARWHDELRFDHPTKGQRWIECWSAPLREPDGAVLWHGYAADVTDRHRLEEQVHAAQRLESVGRLAGGVAHDFNNMLTVILSCAHSLEDALERGAPASADEVQEIRAAAERASDLTRQLLAFARRQVIAPVVLDLNDVLRGSERLLRRALGEDVALTVRLQPGLWPVKADAGQLEQVILNLAVNARDAMPGGGTLLLETRNVEPDALPAPLRPPGEPGPAVCLVVRDSGTGMSEEVRAHLFEPFFTTKAAGKGTGLGLATVHGIVNQSDGRVRVESEPGRGTTFTLAFPRATAAAGLPAPPPAAPRRPAPPSGRGTILVVEDDPLVREVAVRALRAGGYHVLVAAGAADALAQAERDVELDLLVTDVIMPGLDGTRVAEALRRRRPRLPVLYVSGYTADAFSRRGVDDPGVALLEKPFTPSGLLARVQAMLGEA